MTGAVDAQLIAQLQEASQSALPDGERTTGRRGGTGVFPSRSRSLLSAAANAAAGTPDLNGTWYDSNGSRAAHPAENTITVAAINPNTGLPQIIGTGVVQGRFVSINYQNFAGVPGSVQAELAPDGMHMSGTDTNSLLNIPVPNTWHRDHLPSD